MRNAKNPRFFRLARVSVYANGSSIAAHFGKRLGTLKSPWSGGD
jgi:hypothetical protein